MLAGAVWNRQVWCRVDTWGGPRASEGQGRDGAERGVSGEGKEVNGFHGASRDESELARRQRHTTFVLISA